VGRVSILTGDPRLDSCHFRDGVLSDTPGFNRATTS
jgi:hypothetical protein